jgi:hypothetical protein
MKLCAVDTFEDASRIFQYLSGAVAWVEAINADGDPSLGSAFHVGGGVFATARHVVEHGASQIGTTRRSGLSAEPITYASDAQFEPIVWGEPRQSQIEEVLFHPDPHVDVALIRASGFQVPALALDPQVSNNVLTTAMVLGYPRIPLGPEEPTLLAATAQVNAEVTLLDHQRTLILSSIARGGFSGGLVASNVASAIGVVTRSLVVDDGPVEGGYLAAIHIAAVCDCLAAHGIEGDILP